MLDSTVFHSVPLSSLKHTNPVVIRTISGRPDVFFLETRGTGENNRGSFTRSFVYDRRKDSLSWRMYDGVFRLVFVAAVDSEVVVDSGPEQMRLLKLFGLVSWDEERRLHTWLKRKEWAMSSSGWRGLKARTQIEEIEFWHREQAWLCKGEYLSRRDRRNNIHRDRLRNSFMKFSHSDGTHQGIIAGTEDPRYDTEVAAGRLQKAGKIKVLSWQDGKEMEGKGLLTNTLLLKVVGLNPYILTSIELPIETVGSHWLA